MERQRRHKQNLDICELESPLLFKPILKNLFLCNMGATVALLGEALVAKELRVHLRDPTSAQAAERHR